MEALGFLLGTLLGQLMSLIEAFLVSIANGLSLFFGTW